MKSTESKKDIEWVKGKIKDFQTGENMFTAEFNAGVQDALEYVQELIDQLDEPEVLSDKWIDEHEQMVVLMNKGRDDFGNVYSAGTMVKGVPSGKLENLLVPKQELPVIPKIVADWVESRDYYNVYKVLQDLSAPGSPHASKDVRNWIFRNQENVEKFVRAWLDGYTVEEKKYRIHFGNHKYAQRFNEKWLSSQITDKEFASTFTKEEIINLDNSDLYWNNFAEEVTE